MFSNEEYIDVKDFIIKFDGYKFLHSFEMTRNLVFERAKVKRRYINEIEE